jgi:hypothetical protein
MDYQTLGIVVAVVVVVAIGLYVWDRNTKQQQVDVMDAAKLALGAGGIAGGVAYALGGDAISEAVEQTVNISDVVQDMFVGKPGF